MPHKRFWRSSIATFALTKVSENDEASKTAAALAALAQLHLKPSGAWSRRRELNADLTVISCVLYR